jgi:hypothetical protein
MVTQSSDCLSCYARPCSVCRTCATLISVVSIYEHKGSGGPVPDRCHALPPSNRSKRTRTTAHVGQAAPASRCEPTFRSSETPALLRPKTASLRSVGPTPVKVRDIRFKMTIQPITNHQTKNTPTPITGRDALRVSGVLPTALLERSTNQPTNQVEPTHHNPQTNKQTNKQKL